MLQQVSERIGMLGSCYFEEDEVVRRELCLEPQLAGHEMVVSDLYMAYSRERHLLVEIMTEPLSSKAVHTDERNIRAKEQPAVKHWLKGENTTQRKRHAPVGTKLTEPAVTFERIKVVREIAIRSLKVGSSRGKHSFVLRVVMEVGIVTEEMAVADIEPRVSYRALYHESVEVVIVPPHRKVHRKVAHTDVHQSDARLMVVECEVVRLMPMLIDVEVVVFVIIFEPRLHSVLVLEDPSKVHTRLLAKPQRCLKVYRVLRHRVDAVELHRHHGLRIEPEPHVALYPDRQRAPACASGLSAPANGSSPPPRPFGQVYR